jgi:UDP-N-acetylmuramate dehydrogenase
MSKFFQEVFMRRLGDICGNANVLYNEPMKKHTSFRVGGNAKAFVTPENTDAFKELIKYLRVSGIDFFVIGNGSNLLVSDKGYDGVIISTQKMVSVSVKENEITALCGVSLSKLSAVATENSLTGLEFASGIPGSVGGGIVMNAGAYDGELGFVVKNVEYCDENGDLFTVSGDDARFSYRHSLFSDKKLYVMKVVFRLNKGNKKEISDKVAELNERRRDKQPINFPSAGSVFKRPEGHYAGRLIEECGLKGKSIGGAKVSEKHCGFIVNTGSASANNIYELIQLCKKTVFEKQKVKLEPEIKFLGEF